MLHWVEERLEENRYCLGKITLHAACVSGNKKLVTQASTPWCLPTRSLFHVSSIPAQHSPFIFKMAKLKSTHTVRNPEQILRLFRTPLSLTFFLTYCLLPTLRDKGSQPPGAAGLPLKAGRRYVDYLKHIKEERWQGRCLAGPVTNKSQRRSCSKHKTVELKILREMSKASSKITTLDFRKVDFGLLGNLFGKIQLVWGSGQLVDLQGEAHLRN